MTTSTVSSPARPLGSAALVLGIVAVALSSLGIVSSLLLPRLTQSLHASLSSVVAIFSGFTVVTAVTAVVAVILGIVSVVRIPRSTRGGFAIGAGAVVAFGIIFGQILAVALSASIR